MDRPSNKFLAGSGLAGNENGRGSRGDFGNPRKYHSQRRRSANNLLEHRCLADFFAERDILVSQSLFSLLARFNFRSSHVPSSDATVLHQWVVPKQEPSVNAIFSEQSRLKFKWVTDEESILACGPHSLHVVRMSYLTDHVQRTTLFHRKTHVFPGHTVGENPFAVRFQYHNHLGNEINQLLKFLLCTLTLGYINHGTHEFNQIAGWAENRVAHDVDVPDSSLGMEDTVVHFEACPLADCLLGLLTERDLVVRINPLQKCFVWRQRFTRFETEYPAALLGPVSNLLGRRVPCPTAGLAQPLCFRQICFAFTQCLFGELALGDVHRATDESVEFSRCA